MYARVKPLQRRRGLGDVCSVDRLGNRVCGPNPSGFGMTIARPIQGTIRFSPISERVPVTPPISTIANPQTPPWGGWNPVYSSGSGNAGITATQLAQLIQIYNSNPQALTASQWAQLQMAGIIPSTLPYSSASLVATSGPSTSPAVAVNDPQCIAAGMTGGPYPNCSPASSAGSITDFFSTQYGPLTGLAWLGVGFAAWLFFKHKGR